MNSPCQIPICIHQGETYNPPPISFLDDAIPPNIIPLVGYTAILTVRQTVNNSVIALQATTSNGYIYINQTAGQILINIPAEVLSALAPFYGVYDLFIFAPNGHAMYCFGGSFNILESVLQ